MKRRKIKWMNMLLLLIFIGSMSMFFCLKSQSKKNRDAYDRAEQLAGQENGSEGLCEEMSEETAQAQTTEPESDSSGKERLWRELPIEDDPYAESLKNKSLEALRQENEDVIGWIVIPDTMLNYPLMRGEDNEYYLNHDWEKNPNVGGAIFMEQSNDADFSDFNTVIYGHRMKNGSMFGSLKYYSSESFWEAHPYIYILDDAGVHRYEIFAAYEATLEHSTYQIGFSGDASKQKFLDDCKEDSVIDTGTVPTIDDRIITLSTCTGNGHSSRWVVQARRKGQWEREGEPEKDERKE